MALGPLRLVLVVGQTGQQGRERLGISRANLRDRLMLVGLWLLVFAICHFLAPPWIEKDRISRCDYLGQNATLFLNNYLADYALPQLITLNY